MSLANDIAKLVAMGATVSPPMVIPGCPVTTLAHSLEVRRRNAKARSATASLLWQLRSHGISTTRRNREVRFHSIRKWKFDICYPQWMTAVELHGMGSHQSYDQFRSDCEKFSEAFSLGWTVVPVLHSMVHDGSAARLIVQGLQKRGFLHG